MLCGHHCSSLEYMPKCLCTQLNSDWTNFTFEFTSGLFYWNDVWCTHQLSRLDFCVHQRASDGYSVYPRVLRVFCCVTKVQNAFLCDIIWLRLCTQKYILECCERKSTYTILLCKLWRHWQSDLDILITLWHPLNIKGLTDEGNLLVTNINIWENFDSVKQISGLFTLILNILKL